MALELISRNDDFGSAKAANRAILEALKTGYITRNVSIMANAPCLMDGLEELKGYTHACFGMHGTLTSEWDKIKWGPLTDVQTAIKAGLTDENGHFWPTTAEITAHLKDIDLAVKEYEAQLDLLTRLGVKVEYMDSHMFAESAFPELYKAYHELITRKGLMDVQPYYQLDKWTSPKYADSIDGFMKNTEEWLGGLPQNEKPLFYICHPACMSDETCLFANASVREGVIAWQREQEYRCVTSPKWLQWIKQFDVRPLKYTEVPSRY